MIYRFILKWFHAKLERNLGKSNDQFVIMQQSNYFLKVAYIYHPSDLLFLCCICLINASDTGWKVSVFGVILSRIFPHSDWIRRDTLYLVRMRENADQNNSEYGHFARSAICDSVCNVFNFCLKGLKIALLTVAMLKRKKIEYIRR